MVDLSQPSERVVTSEAPRSDISPGEVASPYHMLGQALDKAGESLNAVAEPLAEQAGLRAVSRDEQGNLQVSKAPILGPAGAVYARAMKFSALAQGEAEAKRQDLLLSKQFPDNPEGYLAASKAFRDKTVSEYTDKVGPEVGMSLARSIDSAATYNYRWLLLQQQRQIKDNFNKDMKAVIESKNEDLHAVIATGGADTPAAKHLINGIVDAHNEWHGNPLGTISAEEAKLSLKKIDESVGAAKFAYEVTQTLKDPDGGVNAAMDKVDDVLKDASLSPTQRMINHLHGLATIKEFGTEQTRSVTMARQKQRSTDEMIENAIVADSAKPAAERQITENDVKTNPQMSPESKMKMLGYLKREGLPEPLTRVSQATTMSLLGQIRATDASRLQDNGAIYKAYTDGKLDRADFNFLNKEFNDLRTPAGDLLGKDRTTFFNRFAPTIDSALSGGTHSALGSQKMYEAEMMARHMEDDLRKAGKDPHSVYDPSSPNYFGKQITKYHVSMSDAMNYQKQIDKGGPPPPMTSLSAPPVRVAPAAAPAAPAFNPPRDWQFSASRKQYRDTAGKLYDIDGRPVEGPK